MNTRLLFSNSRSLLLACTCLSMLVSCQAKKQAESASSSEHIVGNDQDKNGCKPSAGYSWSQLQKKCIRPWEGSIHLAQVQTEDSYASAAFVFVDSTQHAAEIFLKEESTSIVLREDSPSTYNKGPYTLQYTDLRWTLSKNKKALYLSSLPLH